MARPRVFVSSTYYDLKHIRASLENFIESLGFEAILFENGDIAYSPDAPLDKSCYREVEMADLFVLLIGGCYGSEASGETKKENSEDFFARYDSITKKEYEHAIKADIPIYILIEKSVDAEYETFLKNQDRTDIKYAHVDSPNVFKWINEIFALSRNNPKHTFDRYAEIESWLRDQWAGLFQVLLTKRNSEKQIATLATQVDKLANVNETIRRYLEEVIKKVVPEEFGKVIEEEKNRLEKAQRQTALQFLQTTDLLNYLSVQFNLPRSGLFEAAADADSFTCFVDLVVSRFPEDQRNELKQRIHLFFKTYERAVRNLAEVRRILSLPAFSDCPGRRMG